MLTISLDEQGNFENDDNKPLFIAGLIFNDKEETKGAARVEEHIERERIRAYYKKAISDAGSSFSYPEDLHSNGDRNRDRNVVALVKDKISETLPEFLKSGTYNGQPLYNDSNRKIADRVGCYNLFVILKSDDGKKKLLAQNVNMLASDEWAANRYFHMASTVVNRIIFHNPLYALGQMPDINLDIATRSTGSVEDMDSDLVEEFEKQSYRANENGATGYKYFSIMNADIYRTLIAQEMISSKKTKINIERLHVKSIQYHPDKKMMEFLYLADSICSILGFDLNGNSADEWLETINDRVAALNSGNDNLVFGYDEIDNDFAEAWGFFERGDYFNALSTTYDAKMKSGKFAEYYADTWFPYIEKCVYDSVNPVSFTSNINLLSSMLTVSNLDQEKLLYLMMQYDRMAEKVSDQYRSQDMKANTLYKLYDAGVSAFCHVGNAKKALEYYEECKKYSFYVGIDAFLDTNNKLVVCLEDSFEWEKALEIAKSNVSSQEMVSEVKREVLYQNSEQDYLAEAKSISQLARIYSEMRDMEAEALYRKALDKLEHGSANYKITQSYLLHFYADMGMKDEFEAEAIDYFDGKTTYNQRLKYILGIDEVAHSAFSNEYALYIWARGLTLFNPEQIDDSLWNKIVKLKETITKLNGREPGGHPWEIIYKYFAVLAIRRNDFENAELFKLHKKNCMNYKGEIITALDMFGDAEIADVAGDIASRDEITAELAKYLNNNFDSMRDNSFSQDGVMRYSELESYFTFMYK